ncbi:MAG TPA: DUF5367 family protein [Thermoanaerobaculia bacterium]|nr:DUF5367 family protein [Thermoanaerobaculia bacterium]
MFRVFLIGLVFWIAGTVVIRLAGELLLRHVIVLYLISFVAMALVARLVFRLCKIPRDDWPKAVTLLALPTLVLDAFTAAYFASVFPNIEAGAAGAFGGWMLICCGGAVAGSWLKA